MNDRHGRLMKQQRERVAEQNRRTDLEEHEDKIFRRASHFRVQRYRDSSSRHDRLQVATFVDAVRTAIDEAKAGNRVLIYAVTATNDQIICVPKRWNDFLRLHLEMTRCTEIQNPIAPKGKSTRNTRAKGKTRP